ncbi:MAG: hypothetical protein HY286_06070 [Planctomycetes bacterium]|nr:hypothetical protein [Planctomycetota bacterium]
MTDSGDGIIMITYQTRDIATGTWKECPEPSMNGWEIAGLERKWKLSTRIRQTFDGRISFQLKVGANEKGAPQFLEITMRETQVSVESSGQSADVRQLNSISLSPGIPTTLFVRLRAVADDRLLKSAADSYYLQIQGAGAPDITFENGSNAQEVTFTKGEATITLVSAKPGAIASLLGFDKVHCGATQMAPITIPIRAGE